MFVDLVFVITVRSLNENVEADCEKTCKIREILFGKVGTSGLLILTETLL